VGLSGLRRAMELLYGGRAGMNGQCGPRRRRLVRLQMPVTHDGPSRAHSSTTRPPARAKIARFLAGDAAVRVAGEADNGEEAIAAVERLGPICSFIPTCRCRAYTGFDVVEALDADAMPKVIFSTATTIRVGLSMPPPDYLLKPYDLARFQRALDKAHQSLSAGPADADVLTQVVADWRARSGAILERLLVKDGETWTALVARSGHAPIAEDK